MKGTTVYVLSFWSTDGFDDFGNQVKVFAAEESAKDYIQYYLCLDWHDDGFGELCKDCYTLVKAEVLI